MKGEELRKRVSCLVILNSELGIMFGNLYTRLGKKAVSKNDGVTMVRSVIRNQRTFVICRRSQKTFGIRRLMMLLGAHMCEFE
jgi:hypothetical protein